MVEQNFEYIHYGGSANAYEQSIFKNMEILMKDKSQLSPEFVHQSDFMEEIKYALRGDLNPEQLLAQTKFYTLVTLKQILCQLVGNIVGNTDIEKTSRSMQIVFHTIIQILQ